MAPEYQPKHWWSNRKIRQTRCACRRVQLRRRLWFARRQYCDLCIMHALEGTIR